MVMTGPRRTLTVTVGWVLVGCLVLGAALVLARCGSQSAGIDPARVRAVCAQYASLDLSGMAALCKDAGYQQMIAPEDLDRP
jgi:hypothetical protein